MQVGVENFCKIIFHLLAMKEKKEKKKEKNEKNFILTAFA